MKVFLVLIGLLLLGCSSVPSTKVREREQFKNGALVLRERTVETIAPKMPDHPSSAEQTIDTQRGIVGRASNVKGSRDWTWTLVVAIPAIGLVVFSAFLLWKGGWTTASIYPACAGFALLAFGFTLQTFPLIYTILIVAAAVAGGIGLFLHIRYAYYKGKKTEG